MITKLEIMLDPESYDGTYVGTVSKATITDTEAKYLVDFKFEGRDEQIIAEISFTKGLNRTTKMLKENGIKKVDELKNVKKVAFKIDNGWVNIMTLGDESLTDESGASGGGGTKAAVDTSSFLK